MADTEATYKLKIAKLKALVFDLGQALDEAADYVVITANEEKTLNKSRTYPRRTEQDFLARLLNLIGQTHPGKLKAYLNDADE